MFCFRGNAALDDSTTAFACDGRGCLRRWIQKNQLKTEKQFCFKTIIVVHFWSQEVVKVRREEKLRVEND